MEINILIQPLPDQGYRASAREPFAVEAEGETREQALQNLKSALADKARQGAEIVTIHMPIPRLRAENPPWPDDDITRAWLEGIAEYRRQCDQQPDSWDPPPASRS
jgi:hypothetical protein